MTGAPGSGAESDAPQLRGVGDVPALAGAEPHPGPGSGHSRSQYLLCPGLSSSVGQARQEGMFLGSTWVLTH